jgi:hypothetical protein
VEGNQSIGQIALPRLGTFPHGQRQASLRLFWQHQQDPTRQSLHPQHWFASPPPNPQSALVTAISNIVFYLPIIIDIVLIAGGLKTWTEGATRGQGPTERQDHSSTMILNNNKDHLFIFGGKDKKHNYNEVFLLNAGTHFLLRSVSLVSVVVYHFIFNLLM